MDEKGLPNPLIEGTVKEKGIRQKVGVWKINFLTPIHATCRLSTFLDFMATFLVLLVKRLIFLIF
jgi:hypothetical protein